MRALTSHALDSHYGCAGPLALHVSHREEPFGSPLVSTAVVILRRRFPDGAINSLFALPETHAQGHGCIVGIVDVEATWPADLFNEVEQSQLTEQAVFPVRRSPSLRSRSFASCPPWPRPERSVLSGSRVFAEDPDRRTRRTRHIG